MQNIIQMAGYMNKFGYIAMIEFKLLQLKQVLNIIEVARYEIVHPHHMHAFFDKAVAKVRSQKTCSARDQYPLSLLSHWCHLNVYSVY